MDGLYLEPKSRSSVSDGLSLLWQKYLCCCCGASNDQIAQAKKKNKPKGNSFKMFKLEEEDATANAEYVDRRPNLLEEMGAVDINEKIDPKEKKRIEAENMKQMEEEKLEYQRYLEQKKKKEEQMKAASLSSQSPQKASSPKETKKQEEETQWVSSHSQEEEDNSAFSIDE